MHALTKPKYFMPIHGECRHLMQHKELALQMGMKENHIIVSDIGKVVEVDKKGIRINGTVPSGRVLVDGYGVGDVGNIVLRDRRHLASDGLIVVVATVDIEERSVISGPDIISRGFVYVRESEELLEAVKDIATDALWDCLEENITDWTQMKMRVKDRVSRYLVEQTNRKPMILPLIMNV